MTARSTYVIVCALIVSLVHCAELSNVQNQLRSFLNTDMVDTAKAGYQPSAFSIAGAELSQHTDKFLSSGTLTVSSGFESSCSDAFLSTAVAADSCIADGVFSYKLQLKQDSCAGAVIQYFFDDACHLFAGSSELAAGVESCSVNYHDNRNRAVYTRLTCTSENKHASAAMDVMTTIITEEPTAEPTAEPTIPPTYAPTARPSVAHTAYPTAAAPASVTIDAQQIISGVSIADWTADQTNNENTVKTTIASCMDGVVASDVTDLLAAGLGSSRVAPFHLRVLAVGDSILIAYRVVTMSQLTSAQLFSQLNNKVTDGTFTILLQQNAAGNTATYLLAAESDYVEIIEAEPDNDSRLSGGAIAAIIVGSIFGAVLVLLALYLLIVGTGSGDANYAHKEVEAGPPAEL